MYLYLTPVPTNTKTNTHFPLFLSLLFSSLLPWKQHKHIITMTQRFHSQTLLLFLVVLVVFLFSHSTASASRVLVPKQQAVKEVYDDGLIAETNRLGMEEVDVFGVIGEEEHCGNGDEECMKRRMIEEAHLDYIYTQHHKP